MKRKILSMVALFAMILSVFLGDVSFFRAEVSAAGTADYRIQFTYNGTAIGADFNSYVTTGNIGIRVVDGAGVEVPGATIRYTRSDTATFADSGVGTGPTSAIAGVGGVGPGIAGGAGYTGQTPNVLTTRLFTRHAGGDPAASYNSATRSWTLKNAGSGGVQNYSAAIAIPTRATGTTEGDRDVFTISAAASVNGTVLAPSTRSFILMPAGERRTAWQNADAGILLFSIYCDEAELFDHDKGILVPGKDREDWIRKYISMNTLPLLGVRPWSTGTPRTRPDFVDYGIMEAYAPTLPANYNRRGRGAGEDSGTSGAEKEAHVEMFGGTNGRRYIAQSVGLRMKGGWSRGTYAYEQRTFEIYARNGYGAYSISRLDNFEFPLFGTDHEYDSEGNMIQQYRRFRLRNGGSDRDGAYLRDEMASTLWTQAGYPHPQNYRPAIVFLNGAYYGMSYVKSPRTENHWDAIYGGKESQYHITANGERMSEQCESVTCGMVIPTINASATPTGAAVNQSGTNGAGTGTWFATQVPSVNNADYPTGNLIAVPGLNPGTYAGHRPQLCSGSTRCGPGGTVCTRTQYHSNANATCGPTHEAVCTRKSGNSCRSNGCAAACDWAQLRALVLGDSAYGFAAVPGNGTLNPNGFTGTDGLARWNKFKELVDVDNLLRYYAMNAYGGNIDWPGNNIEAWRYFPTAEEKADPTVHPYLRDGRWRFVANDLEMGWSIWSLDNGATLANHNHINTLISRGGTPGGGGHYGAGVSTTYMMRAILGGASVGSGDNAQPQITPVSQAEARAKFANVISDLIAGAMRPENAQAVFDNLAWKLSYEHQNVMLAMNATDNTRLPNRRIAEIHRTEIQPGVKDSYMWPAWSRNDIASTPARHDSVFCELSRIRAFLGGTAATQANPTTSTARATFTTADNSTCTSMTDHVNKHTAGGGRANATTGFPSFVTATLGLNWASARSISIDFGLVRAPGEQSVPGSAVMNTRPVGVDNLAYNNATLRDPRSAGKEGQANNPNNNESPRVTGQYFPVTTTSGDSTPSGVPVLAKPTQGYVANWAGTATYVVSANDPNQIYVTAGGTLNLSFVRDPNFTGVGTDKSNTRVAPRIDEVKAESFNTAATGDYVKIFNPTDRTITTKGMYLTDDSNGDDWKWQMPSFIIEPHKFAMVKTDSITNTVNALKRSAANFNLGFNERLRLIDAQGKIWTRVEVALMSPEQYQLRDTYGDGKFYVRDPSIAGAGPGWHHIARFPAGGGKNGFDTNRGSDVAVKACVHGVLPPDPCKQCNPPAMCPRHPAVELPCPTCVPTRVWSANLVGATNTTPTARNYIANASGQLMGILVGSSTPSGPVLSINGSTLIYNNTRSANMPLRIVTGGNGWSAAGGFTPIAGRKYEVRFTAVGTFQWSATGSASDRAPATPVSGNNYVYSLTWPGAGVEDGSHGTTIVGMTVALDATVTFSNIEIWEIP